MAALKLKISLVAIIGSLASTVGNGRPATWWSMWVPSSESLTCPEYFSVAAMKGGVCVSRRCSETLISRPRSTTHSIPGPKNSFHSLTLPPSIFVPGGGGSAAVAGAGKAAQVASSIAVARTGFQLALRWLVRRGPGSDRWIFILFSRGLNAALPDDCPAGGWVQGQLPRAGFGGLLS